MRALPVFVVTLTLALALTACGDGDNDSAVSSSRAATAATGASSSATSETTAPVAPGQADAGDQAIADAAILTTDDMPAGWTSEPNEDNDNSVTDQEVATCLGVDLSEVESDANASADSDDFKSPENVTISSSAEVAPDEAWMINAFEIQNSEKFRECLGESAKKAFAEEGDVEWGEPRISPMVFRTYGDETMGIRVTVPATSQGQELELTTDLLMARVGRANVALTAISVNGPVASSELSGYLETVVEKLRSGLGDS